MTINSEPSLVLLSRLGTSGLGQGSLLNQILFQLSEIELLPSIFFFFFKWNLSVSENVYAK